MDVIKKIFDGIFDDEVHGAFLKFGRGEYRDKYLIEGKRQAKKWAIKSGSEYVKYFVRKCLGKVGERVGVSGVVVSTLDFTEEIKFEIKNVSNFQGIRKYVVDCEVNPVEIIEMMDRFPRVFYALSFKSDDFVLKIKAKAPKSGKPGKEGDAVADFCSLKTNDGNLVEELFFDVGNFNEVKVNHTIEVSDIVYPENFNELPPKKVRELSKRKGVVVRNVVVDGVEQTSKAEFVV